MEIINKENYVQFKSSDDNGNFTITLCKRYPYQLQMSAQDELEESYVDVDTVELTAIRDMIDGVLNEGKSNTLRSVIANHGLDSDFESKIAKLIDYKCRLSRGGVPESECEELDEIQDWFQWGGWESPS